MYIDYKITCGKLVCYHSFETKSERLTADDFDILRHQLKLAFHNENTTAVMEIDRNEKPFLKLEYDGLKTKIKRV